MDDDFDLQAAWLRRFSTDAEGQLAAFARRLREAMPDHVTLHEKRGLFSASRITGLSVHFGDNDYRLAIENRRLQASIALTVRGVTLNTRQMPPAEWFARLQAETRQESARAQALARSLDAFMAG